MDRVVMTSLFDGCTLFREGLKCILSGTRYRVVSDGAWNKPVPANRSLKSREVLLLVGASQDLVELARNVRRLKHGHPRARIVLLGDECNHDAVASAVRAGAHGYLVKTISSSTLLKSLDLIMLGERIVPSEFLQHVCEHLMLHETGNDAAALPIPERQASQAGGTDRPALNELFHRPFSEREDAVLSCLLGGELNKSIARRFDIAEATVKVHIKAILRKINVKNRTQAAMWAATHNWLPRNDAMANGTARAMAPSSDRLNGRH